MSRKRRLKPGNLAELQRVLWRTVVEVEGLLDDEDCPPDRVLRAAHAMAQVAGAYKTVVEAASLEARIMALENAAERTHP